MILTPVLQNIEGGGQFSVRCQFSGYTRIHVLQVVSGRFIFQVMFSLVLDGIINTGRLALQNPGTKTSLVLDPGFSSYLLILVLDPGLRSWFQIQISGSGDPSL